MVRAGYRLFTGTSGSGAELAAGSGAWSQLSDRAMKTGFKPVREALSFYC
eukprot:SAG22_NODE_8321_length_665_cov_0.537102_2_plen_49_part_01